MANPNPKFKVACVDALNDLSGATGMLETVMNSNSKNNDANNQALSALGPLKDALSAALGRAPVVAPEAAKVAGASEAPVDSQGPSLGGG